MGFAVTGGGDKNKRECQYHGGKADKHRKAIVRGTGDHGNKVADNRDCASEQAIDKYSFLHSVCMFYAAKMVSGGEKSLILSGDFESL